MHAATPLLLITLALAAPLSPASAQPTAQPRQSPPARERKPSNDATPALRDNAALIYYSVWTMENRDDAKVFSEFCGTQEFGKALPQALHDALVRNQPMIARIIRASKMKYCDFGRDFNEGFAMLLPELAKLRALARLLVADADRCLVEGKPDEAAERYAAVFGLARHSGQDRVLISGLVAIALANFTADDLVDHKAAAMLTPAGRAKVLAAIDRLNGAEGFGLKGALQGERELAIHGTILKYEGPDAGRRFADEVLGIMATPADARPDEPQVEKIRQLDGAGLRAEAMKLDRFYDRALQIWNSPSANETLKTMSEAATAGEFGLLGHQLLPALTKCRASQDKGVETLKRIASALRQADADEERDIKEGRKTPRSVTHQPTQPAHLLLAMHRGDEAAARALWQTHAGRLTALARAITCSHADALDAVQEAFVAVLSLSAAQAAAIDDEGFYLAGAVRTRALNLLRSASRRATRERESAPLRLVGKPGEDPALEEALQSLPLDAREVVALKHLAGLTFDQMAVALGVPRATASTRYYSAIEQLRSALGAPRSTREVVRA